MNHTNTKKRFKTLDLAYIAMGAVLITLCSWISIPMTVPFTMQTLAVFLVLSLLGGARGTAAIVIYLTLGAIGVPVYAEFSAGVGILFGMTGGYLLGFILMGLTYWLATKLFGKKLPVELFAMALGLILLYVFGTAWYMIVYNRGDETIGLLTALSWCVFPFIIPDVIKLGLAIAAAKRIAAAHKTK